MKVYHLLLFLSVFSNSIFAQTNESPAEAYEYKGNKTVPQAGYVVLKSGKKLEGSISIKGSLSAPQEIAYEGDGKSIDFPPAAISAFGLSKKAVMASADPINDSNENLYTWRNMGVVMNKVITNTKPREGYIILKDGTRHEGELQLIRHDGALAQIKLKGEDKFKLEPQEVGHYGISMTVDDYHEGGEKMYKDAPRNFYEGTILLLDGTENKGYIAFKEKQYINPNRPNLGDKYMGVFYASSKESPVKTFDKEKIKDIYRMEEGNKVHYYKYEGGFVSQNEMADKKFGDQTKMYQPGEVTLMDGPTKKGEIALDKKGKFYAEAIMYKDPSGKVTVYDGIKIEGGYQMIDGEKVGFTNIKGYIVEEVYNGNTFHVYRNPTPTTINESKTSLAQGLMTTATTGIASAAVNADEKKNDYETNLDSIIMVSSAEELKEIQSAFIKVQGYSSSDELQEYSNNESAKNYDSALSLAIMGKEGSKDLAVYNKEYIILNKKTNEATVVYKSDDKKILEPLMMGCYTYLSLDKKDQKDYLKIENLQEAAAMLDECY